MTTHILTGLDGRTPLGWLATLGLVRLLDEEADHPSVAQPRLGWDATTGQARLAVRGDLDEVVAAVVDVTDRITDEALLPGGPPAFPAAKAPKDWPRGDPMRMPQDHFAEQVDNWRTHHTAPFIDRWVPAMVTDQATDDSGCVEITNYAAPSGQQTFKTMFAKTLEHIRKDPGVLGDALTSWRRVDGVTGEYLDHRVLRSAADRPEGRSIEAGVPGATWLALMALPWLPTFVVNDTATSTGWQSQPHRRPVMIWPLWSELVPVPGIRCLVAHPGLAIASPPGAQRSDDLQVDANKLRPLSVFAVCGAQRQPIQGRNFAGVLTPTSVKMT